MRLVQILLLFSLNLFLSGCDSDDHKNSLNFSAASLKQTQWKGTFDESYIASFGEPVSTTANAGIFFESETRGRYSLKWETMDQPTESTFEYRIEEKVLIVENGGVLNGYWLLTQSDKDTMVLEKGTNGEGAYKGILTLKRTS